jgi:hypothetical protein
MVKTFSTITAARTRPGILHRNRERLDPKCRVCVNMLSDNIMLSANLLLTCNMLSNNVMSVDKMLSVATMLAADDKMLSDNIRY